MKRRGNGGARILLVALGLLLALIAAVILRRLCEYAEGTAYYDRLRRI